MMIGIFNFFFFFNLPIIPNLCSKTLSISKGKGIGKGILGVSHSEDNLLHYN